MSLLPLNSVSNGETVVKLPHPYHTEYGVAKVSESEFRVVLKSQSSSKLKPAKQPPTELHNAALRFTEPVDLKSSELPSQSNNSAWARARRSPSTTVRWDSAAAPTLAQAWLLLYVLFTVRPSMETLRLELAGEGAPRLGQQLKDVFLAIDHPERRGTHDDSPVAPAPPKSPKTESLVVAVRSAFWQGAGSPFGPRPVWCPEESPASLLPQPLSSYPLTPAQHTITVSSAGDPEDPARTQQAWHPIRPAKPAPGAVIYSRYIPHLGETFSMVSLDWENAEHLQLFHDWQNDPRVSQGWNETGTLDQHREYLRKMHVDPHQVAVLAKWDDTYFAYFEIYWAKVRDSP